MKKIFVYSVSFILVALSAMLLSSKPLAVSEVVTKEKKEFPDLPKLTGSADFPIISAQSAIAVDTKSGVILFEKNADLPLLPASTTKIVTALISLDAYGTEEVLTVGPEVIIEGQKMGLVLGESISVQNLLYGLLVQSANDAAEVLATNYPAGREVFIEEMNNKAKSLHLENTIFENPSGLDGAEQVSTARDLARVAEEAMKIPDFARIVGTEKIMVTSTDGKNIHKLQNVNELLGEVEGVKGVKTGWTENARENLVTLVERDGRVVVLALLGGQDRFGETKEVIEWIFENYEWEEVSPISKLKALTPEGV